MFLRRWSCLEPVPHTAPDREPSPQLSVQLVSWNMEQKWCYHVIKNTQLRLDVSYCWTPKGRKNLKVSLPAEKSIHLQTHAWEWGLVFRYYYFNMHLVFLRSISITCIGITRLVTNSSISHWRGDMGREFVAASGEAQRLDNWVGIDFLYFPWNLYVTQEGRFLSLSGVTAFYLP